MAGPPSADDADAYIWIDHREEEDAIVEMVSERLDPADALSCQLNDDGALTVMHRGREHRIPLQQSPHDRYIAISSLGVILQDRYTFFLLDDSLGDDTHALLVAPREDGARWVAPHHLTKLALGFDYFHDIDVPYLGKLDNAPNFEAERIHVEADHATQTAAAEAWLHEEMKTNKELRDTFAATRRLGRPWWKFW